MDFPAAEPGKDRTLRIRSRQTYNNNKILALRGFYCPKQ